MPRWIGSAVIIVAAALLLPQVGKIRPGFDPLGPAFLPSVVLWSVIALGVLDILVHLKRPDTGPRTADDLPASLNMRSMVTVLLLVLYIGAIASRLLPFEIITSVFLVTLISLLRRPPWMQFILIVVGSAVLSFTLGYVFRSVLFVFLP